LREEIYDVAVCTYNSSLTLDECLMRITKSIPLRRLVVVDKFSKDGTVEIARKYGATIVQSGGNLGEARVLAISMVETPLFFFVDSDVYISKEWVEAILAFKDRLEREKVKWGVIGGLTIPWWEPYKSYIFEAYLQREYPIVNPERLLLHAVLVNRRAVEDWRCSVTCCEDFLLGKYLAERGYSYYTIREAVAEHHNQGKPHGILGRYAHIFSHWTWGAAGIRNVQQMYKCFQAEFTPGKLFKGVFLAPLERPRYAKLLFLQRLAWFIGYMGWKRFLTAHAHARSDSFL